MRIQMRTLVERASRWLVNNRRHPLDSQATVDHFSGPVQTLMAQLPELMTGRELESWTHRRDAYVARGVSEDLAGRVAALDRTTRELAESRRRLVEADDAARRALESAITRDVSPFLESLPEEIRQVRAGLPAVDDRRFERLVDDLSTALSSLRRLTRGVFPAQLAAFGLEPTLRSLLAESGSGAQLTVDGAAGRRYPPRLEAAVYFCCAEAVRASSAPPAVVMSGSGALLELRIGARLTGMDLRAVIDRVEAAGGVLSMKDELLVLAFPLAGEPDSAIVDGAAGLVPGR
jgi:hypothetical protein